MVKQQCLFGTLLMGLLSGGDDYVLKPFSLKELDARIIAHLKREERLHRKTEQALEVLEQEESDTENDEMMEIINSTVGKLQQIEDKYYYSLDLNYYLNNLEDDAYEA